MNIKAVLRSNKVVTLSAPGPSAVEVVPAIRLDFDRSDGSLAQSDKILTFQNGSIIKNFLLRNQQGTFQDLNL